METVDLLILGFIVAVFGTFAGVLAWVAHIDYKRPSQPSAGE